MLVSELNVQIVSLFFKPALYRRPVHPRIYEYALVRSRFWHSWQGKSMLRERMIRGQSAPIQCYKVPLKMVPSYSPSRILLLREID